VEQLVQQLAAGLSNGAIYALMALALVMIFVSTSHINFAQGEMAMFSTYLAWAGMQSGLSFWPALAVTVAASFLIGISVERLVVRPLRDAPHLSIVVVFIALLAIFHAFAGAIWGFALKAVPSPFADWTVVSNPYLGPHQLGMLAVTGMMLAAILAFFRCTRLGLAMRAAAENPTSARLSGIPVDTLLALGWGMAAGIGAVAGCLVAPVLYLEPGMMSGVLLYGFAAALVGGISNPAGAVAGGFIVGIVENLVAFLGARFEAATGIYVFGTGEKLTLALVIIVAMLVVKPGGLFSGHRRERA